MKLEVPPADLVRMVTVLAEHKGNEPMIDREHPSIEVWTEEADGQRYRWLLIAVLDRTCVVASPRDHYHRVVRAHRLVWIHPNSLRDWQDLTPRGFSLKHRAKQQAELGRVRSLESRKAQGMAPA